MVEQIYDQLKIPKTFDVIYQRFQEIGINWNTAQVELFLQLDRNIVQQGEVYYIEFDNSDEAIVEVIDKAIEGRPIIPVKKIMDLIPQGVMVSDKDIIRIAIDSGRYRSPNNAVIAKI